MLKIIFRWLPAWERCQIVGGGEVKKKKERNWIGEGRANGIKDLEGQHSQARNLLIVSKRMPRQREIREPKGNWGGREKKTPD